MEERNKKEEKLVQDDPEKELAKCRQELKLEKTLNSLQTAIWSMEERSALTPLISLLFEQTAVLGPLPYFCFFGILNENEKKGNLSFFKSSAGLLPEVASIPFSEDPVLEAIYSSWSRKDDYLIIDLSEEGLKKFLSVLQPHLPGINLMEILGGENPGRLVLHLLHFQYGSLGIAYQNAEHDFIPVLHRIAKTAEQGYRRALDFRKMEVLYGEYVMLNILEKLMERILEMRTPNEFDEVAGTILNEIGQNGIEPARCAIGVIDKETMSMEWWYSIEGSEKAVGCHLPIDDHSWSLEIFEGWRQGKPFLYIDPENNESPSGQFRFEAIGKDEIPENLKAVLKERLGWNNNALYVPMDGGLLEYGYGATMDGAPLELLKRFAKIIDLACKRKQDLKAFHNMQG